MSLPGRSTTTVDQSAPRGPRLRLATPFVIGELTEGEATPTLITSLRDLQRKCGARTADTAEVHDWIDAHFHEGGAAAYVMPLRGPAATEGDPDFDGITTAEITAAAEAFSSDLGPGNFVLPGRTDTTSILAVAAVAVVPDHGKRLVKADLVDTSTVATLTTAAATLRASDYADIIDILAGRLTIPGLADGTARTVPLSALRSGCEGRNDKAGESPNQPAAGRWGIARYATAYSQAWSDTDRETLNDAGVNVAKVIDGDLRLYGARTAADPATAAAAIRLGSARLRAAIIELAGYELERVEFGEIDQGGVALGNLKGNIKGRIQTYARSLYSLDVDAQILEEVDQPGTYYVEATVDFQAAPDAERTSAIITRAVTEV